MARSLLCHLACAASNHVLVALPATLCVIGGPEAVLNILNTLEDRFVGIERCLVDESVGDVIETGGCLSSTTGQWSTSFRSCCRGRMEILHALLESGTRWALRDQGKREGQTET